MQDFKPADSWCRRISNSRTFSVSGPNAEWVAYTPCCAVHTPGCTVLNRQDLDRVNKDIKEYVHRNKNIVCAPCIEREKIPNGKRSIRQLGHNVIDENAPWGEIQLLSFQLDTRCNAACVMCGPSFSTLWQQELGQSVGVTEKKVQETLDQVCSWIDWPFVKCIHFSGGESLLTTTTEKILRHVPDLSRVEIRYQTNGSVAPSQTTLDIWRQAQQIKLEISLDGTHEQYNYIRHPLDWHKVEQNIVDMTEFLEINCVNAEIHINCTVNPMNLMYLKNLDAWYGQMQSKYSIFKTLEYHKCIHTNWGLEGVSYKFLEKFTKTHGFDHPANALFYKITLSPVTRQRLLDNLGELDQRRKLDWKTTFPESISLFD